MSTENVHLLELSWKGEEFLNPKEAKKKKKVFKYVSYHRLFLAVVNSSMLE